jgi:hypothetical protein
MDYMPICPNCKAPVKEGVKILMVAKDKRIWLRRMDRTGF